MSCHRKYDNARCGFPPPPSQRRTDITTEQVQQLWEKGLTKSQIAKRLGTSRGPVEVRLKECGLWSPGRARWKC
jgi:DNA-binding NarL/FixJ family response regulator